MRVQYSANSGDKAAESRFKEANEAHEVLSDRKKREEYDAIRQGGFAAGFPGAGPFGGSHPPGGFRAESFDFADILGDMLRGGGARSSHPGRGSDIRIEISVDFLDMVRGAVREIRYPRSRVCGQCGGTGRAGRRGCPACYGRGVTESQERVKIRIPAGARDGIQIRFPGPHGTLRLEAPVPRGSLKANEANPVATGASDGFSQAAFSPPANCYH